jgi:hypothetical protein
MGRPFAKGQSGNPGGRPKIPDGVKERARGYSVQAIETLAEIMRNPTESGTARIAAADKILDRAWGKPGQHVTANSIDNLSGDELRRELVNALAGLRALGVDLDTSGDGDDEPEPGTAH